MQARSYLYVPADRPERLAKVGARGSDAVIVDLEDAVGEQNRTAAVVGTTSWLNTATERKFEIWVRVAAGATGLDAIEALAGRKEITGFYLAKTEHADTVSTAAKCMEAAGREAVLVPILESARAVSTASAIAAVPGVVRLQLGEADLRAELGITLSPDERELLAIRTAIVLASGAAGLRAPVAPVDVEFTDEDGFAHRTFLLRRMGFFGRACIHPRQVPIVNRVFSPSATEVAHAQGILDALAASGGAATIGPHGEMIDAALGRQARRILAEADSER